MRGTLSRFCKKGVKKGVRQQLRFHRGHIGGMETATIWQRSGRWAHLQQQASLHGQSAKSPSSVVQVSAARLSFAALLPLV